MDLLLTIVALTATAIGSATAMPQARRLARTRRVDGVSPTWIGVSVALNGWWIAYAVASELWLLLPVTVSSLTLYTITGVFYLRTVGTTALPAIATGALVLGMIPLPFLLVGGWGAAGLALGLSYGVQLLPAMIRVLRTDALAGIAAGTWAIVWSEALLWLIYGLGVSDVALVTSGVAGVSIAGVVLARLVSTGHARLPWSRTRAAVEPTAG